MIGKDELIIKLTQLRANEEFLITNYSDLTKDIKTEDIRKVIGRILKDERRHYKIVDDIIKSLEN